MTEENDLTWLGDAELASKINTTDPEKETGPVLLGDRVLEPASMRRYAAWFHIRSRLSEVQEDDFARVSFVDMALLVFLMTLSPKEVTKAVCSPQATVEKLMTWIDEIAAKGLFGRVPEIAAQVFADINLANNFSGGGNSEKKVS